MKINWLQHVSFEGLGSIAGWAAENGCPVTGSRMFAGDALPSITDVDLLTIMGGPMSVNDEGGHPWLVDEKRFIGKAVDSDKMVLGICLGAQLIASAAGSRIRASENLEVGWFSVVKTKAAKKTRVDQAMADKAEVFHFPMAPFTWRAARAAKTRPFAWGMMSSAFTIIGKPHRNRPVS